MANTNTNVQTLPNGFAYGNEDAYQALLRRAAQPAAFRYNPAADQTAAAYANMYRREGDRATANTLAKAAAATGGVPSSYAVGAAQQAGAYYASQLADKQAELEQQAYNRYLQEQAQTMQGLNTLRTDRNDAYGMHLDELQKQKDAGNGIVTELENELQPTGGGGSDEYTTTNPQRDGMVEVGGKLMTWTDLYSKLGNEIEVVTDDVNKTFTFRYKQ